MKRMAARAAEAEGCFGAQACESDQDRNALVAVSRWKSEQAMEAFANRAESITEEEHLNSLLEGSAQRENLKPI